MCNYSFSFGACLTGSFSNRSARISKIICCYGKRQGVEGFDDLLTANSFSFRWVQTSPSALFGSCSNKKRHIFLSRTSNGPMYHFSADTHECIFLPVQSIDGLCVPSELGIHVVCFVFTVNGLNCKSPCVEMVDLSISNISLNEGFSFTTCVRSVRLGKNTKAFSKT